MYNFLDKYLSKQLNEAYVKPDPDWALMAQKLVPSETHDKVPFRWFSDGDTHIFIEGDFQPGSVEPIYTCYSDLEASQYFDLYQGYLFDNADEDIEFISSLDEALLEVMSAEDRHDSDILKSIIDKTEVRTNAKLTDEEKAVLTKYGLDRYNHEVIIPGARHYTISDDDLSNPRGGNQKERSGARFSYDSHDPRRVYHNDPSQVNYADIARKRGVRSQAKVDAILNDKITKYADDRTSLKNKQFYRDYHKGYIDKADETYEAAIKKARDDYDRAIAVAEKARDQVDDYHRPEYERYAAEIDSMLRRTPKK